MEILFGSTLALVLVLFGAILGATLKGFVEADPYEGAITHPSPNSDTDTDDPATLEQAASYRTGNIQLHVVEINDRHWVSADPDLGEEFHKYLSGDVYRSIQEYENGNSE